MVSPELTPPMFAVCYMYRRIVRDWIAVI